MSSPFTQFRKNQKTYLAVLGVVCMVAFVFGGVTCSNDQPAQANPVAASTKYGDLHNSDLAHMSASLDVANRFLMGVMLESAMKGPQFANMRPEFLAPFIQRQLEQSGLIVAATESEAVDTMLLKNKAQELGVVVSDAAINDFIRQITENRLSRDEIAGVISSLRISNYQLFDALRTRLMALRVRSLFGRGLVAAPPAQQWEYFQRLNRRARTELVAIPVSDFVSQVPDPSEAELRKFFEEGKNRVAQPGSPEIGFKQPHKVALQYLKAEYDKFYNEAEVTDEEIAEHYEKNKKNYPYTDLPLELPKAEEKPADKPDAEKPAAEKKQPSEDSKPSSKPAEKAKPEAEKKPEKKDAPKESTEKVKPESEKPAAKQKEAAKDTSEKAKPESDKPASAKKEEPQESSEESKPTEKKSDEKPAAPPDEKSDAQDAEAQDDGCQADDAAKKPADAANAKQPADTADAKQPAPTTSTAPADAAQPATTESAAKPAEQGATLLDLTSQYGLPRDIREGPKPAEAPLWSVKDRIRRELAGQKARQKMEETLAKVQPILSRYYNDLAVWKSEHRDPKNDSAHPRPTPPNIVELAKQYGLSAHEIGLSSLHHVLTETDLGQAISGRGATFVSQTLEPPSLFKANTVQDAAGNQFMFWKTDDVPEHVPSFDDSAIRSEVLAAWKQLQARDLAQKQAESLAEKARAAEQPLAAVFAEQKNLKVVEAGPFTWMTQGNQFMGPQEPRITAVPGVDSPGADFMSAVFDLAVGEVGVAFNAPKTEAYVVRVTSLEPSPRVLLEKFMAETPSPQQQQTYSSLSLDEHMEASRHWMEEIRATAGLHWKREAIAEVMR